MKRIVVIVAVLSIVFTSVFAQSSMDVSAQTSARKNQKKLIRYIKRNGKLKFKYKETGTYTIFQIKATKSKIKFYTVTKTPDMKLKTWMTVKVSNYPIAKIKFKATDPYGSYMKAHKSVYCSEFKPKKKYSYYIKSNYPMTNGQINGLMKKMMGPTIIGWKNLLKESGITMKKLGFKKIK